MGGRKSVNDSTEDEKGEIEGFSLKIAILRISLGRQMADHGSGMGY